MESRHIIDNSRCHIKSRALAALLMASILPGCGSLIKLTSNSWTECKGKTPVVQLPNGEWAEVTDKSTGNCDTYKINRGWDDTPTQARVQSDELPRARDSRPEVNKTQPTEIFPRPEVPTPPGWIKPREPK